jgi:hypothetical protein
MKRLLAVVALLLSFGLVTQAQGVNPKLQQQGNEKNQRENQQRRGGDLKATATATTVTLTFTPSASGGSSTNVYRAPCPAVVGTVQGSGATIGTCAAPGAFILVGNAAVALTTFVDSAVVPGTSYAYQVTALCPAAGCTTVNTAGESTKAPVPALGVTTSAAVVPPAPPTNVILTAKKTITSTGQETIVATWKADPAVQTEFMLVSKGTFLIHSMVPSNSTGTYSQTWSGAIQTVGVLVCDGYMRCAFKIV